MDEGFFPVRSRGAMRRRAQPRAVRPAELPGPIQTPPRSQRSIREIRLAEQATQGPLPTDFANSTKALDNQVSFGGGVALRKQPNQAVNWEAISEAQKRVAQVIRETNARSGAQLAHQQQAYRQLTEAGLTGAHAEGRNNAPDALRQHADEMRQLVRDLQPEARVAVANATVARAVRGYPQHFFYGSEGDDARTTTSHSGFRVMTI